MIRFWGQKVKG